MPRPKKTVTNADVQEILNMREELKAYEGKAAATKEALKSKETEIHNIIKKNPSLVESLKWDIIPKTIERRFPKWKEWFCHFVGEPEAEKIMAKTEPVKYYTLVIRKKTKVVE